MCERYEICKPSKGGDFFDEVATLEGKQIRRMARAVKAARALRARLTDKRRRRFANKYARRHGYSDAEAMEKDNFRPWQRGKRTPKRAGKKDRSEKDPNRFDENPFTRHDPHLGDRTGLEV